MRIGIVTPAPKGSRAGNRVTARRWAELLRELGHDVELRTQWKGETWDLLIALHARKSAETVFRHHEQRPRVPIVVGLAGTDLYRDLADSPEAREALEKADRLVVLQERALDELPAEARRKTRVILQSSTPLANPPAPRVRTFDVAVIGHLRPVKDPFRTAMAARLLPADSKLRVLHVGAALTPDMERRARREEERNERYTWLGEKPRWEARRILARSRLLSITSHLEGGANVVSEALTAGVPVIASRVPGNVGLVGESYPGLFPVEDTEALADLLHRAERDEGFLLELSIRCERLARRFHPHRERTAWKDLLHELDG